MPKIVAIGVCSKDLWMLYKDAKGRRLPGRYVVVRVLPGRPERIKLFYEGGDLEADALPREGYMLGPRVLWVPGGVKVENAVSAFTLISDRIPLKGDPVQVEWVKVTSPTQPSLGELIERKLSQKGK